jgi:hypothetical protein
MPLAQVTTILAGHFTSFLFNYAGNRWIFPRKNLVVNVSFCLYSVYVKYLLAPINTKRVTLEI